MSAEVIICGRCKGSGVAFGALCERCNGEGSL